MKNMPFNKYRSFVPLVLKDRTWPNNRIEKAPMWCSVDLRDGNQALVTPMMLSEKLEFFQMLIKLGFKEIEVAFPSAAQVEFDFVRKLIEDELIPEDVTIQVLTQAREHLIRRTFESLKGVKRAVLHLYNSTSTLQRQVVFNKSREEIKNIAVQAAKLVAEETAKMKGSEIVFEYSPESFMGTEMDYSIEVCDAVLSVWKPTAKNKTIINLPNTVELSGPHVYADQIESFHRQIPNRRNIILSTHTHNDRGCAVAAAEFAVQAGADRVEGTLFGNGERTGNVDLITMALNLLSHGVDPKLDFSHINSVIEMSERLTKIPVHARHPYAGELVYTAFSGSHQDAINKGMKYYQEVLIKETPPRWEVPYLPIDPADVGRSYESIIRINSQSGKGGVAFVLENEYGYALPKAMHAEFGKVIQSILDRSGEIMPPEAIFRAFEEEYIKRKSPISLEHVRILRDDGEQSSTEIEVRLSFNGKSYEFKSHGNGPIDSFVKGLSVNKIANVQVINYHQHGLGSGSEAKAAAYVEIETEKGERLFGVGLDTSIVLAGVRAVASALNRSLAKSTL